VRLDQLGVFPERRRQAILLFRWIAAPDLTPIRHPPQFGERCTPDIFGGHPDLLSMLL
jgi:hypothetical protein